MKIAIINSVPYGSTGKIAFAITNLIEKENGKTLVGTGYSSHPLKNLPSSYIQIGSFFSKSQDIILSTISGKAGVFSYFATKKFLKRVKEFNPDIIHLHNIHGNYINLPLLFKFIKKNNIKVVWTLHDCWAFTGHCPYFDLQNCEKWKTGCFNCPIYKEYPKSLFDNSKKMYKLKKKWFIGVKDLTIITPSVWLANLVKQSYINCYMVKVINNGIDLSIFKPMESCFREKYNLQNKFIILGVAFGWGKRKGLDVFIQLAKQLDERFQIVLVGTDENIDKLLPTNIISIYRTNSQTELAEIYSSVDVFANPTREENYPTVNMEAIACGTPVVTFNTGGSPEIINEKTGIIVEKDDFIAFKNAIEKVCIEKPFSKENCILRAKDFDDKDRFKEYIDLYNEFIK